MGILRMSGRQPDSPEIKAVKESKSLIHQIRDKTPALDAKLGELSLALIDMETTIKEINQLLDELEAQS
jgi:predicted  nucleic acid-binding Zn-ribbon protein